MSRKWSIIDPSLLDAVEEERDELAKAHDLDMAVIEGLHQRIADLEARLAATEDAERLASNRAKAAEGALRALVAAELRSHRYDVYAAIEAAESLLRAQS